MFKREALLGDPTLQYDWLEGKKGGSGLWEDNYCCLRDIGQ